METATHITAIVNDGKLFAEAAERGGLDNEVPACPGWDVRQLVRHLGMIHLWAAGHVAFPHEEPDYQSEDEELAAFAEFWPELGTFWPVDGDLVHWYRRTNANLVNALESASPTVEAWTFLQAPSPHAMWARRQAHEIAIHRFDAQEAAGLGSEFDPAFAADGIDEILAAFATRKPDFPVDEPRAMLVHASDTGDRWQVTMAPDGITTVRDDGPADTTLMGRAGDLYLAMWNRGDDTSLEVTGDRDLLELWHGNVRVRWS
jgi:uncharacterized protein (TIGR03083 family)